MTDNKEPLACTQCGKSYSGAAYCPRDAQELVRPSNDYSKWDPSKLLGAVDVCALMGPTFKNLCLRCAKTFTSEFQFCPLCGDYLETPGENPAAVQLNWGSPAESSTANTAPQVAQKRKRCPDCGQSFEAERRFCSYDGEMLVDAVQ